MGRLHLSQTAVGMRNLKNQQFERYIKLLSTVNENYCSIYVFEPDVLSSIVVDVSCTGKDPHFLLSCSRPCNVSVARQTNRKLLSVGENHRQSNNLYGHQVYLVPPEAGL
jgi:hypothetical protein